MKIDDYFKANGIQSKSPDEIRLEPIPKDVFYDDSKYYEFAYETGRDLAEICIDFELDSMMYESILKGVQTQPKKTLVVEPGCGSGILGCYIALNTGFDYIGIDKSKAGISKAKERAKMFNLNNVNFIQDDFSNFKAKQQNIVAIGRFNIIDSSWQIIDCLLQNISRSSDKLFLIEGHYNKSCTKNVYKLAIGRHGYKLNPLTDVKRSYAHERYVFAFEGSRN